MPTDKELEAYYHSFNEDYHGGGRAKGAKKRQNRYAEKYLKIVNEYSYGKLLIDIGSSNNPFPNIAKKCGYSVTVVDYVKPKELLSDISFIPSRIEDLMSIKLQFDVVTAFAIIEHTKDPILALKNLIKLSKVNGIIIIYIPEIGEFPDKFSLGTSKWLFPPEHLNLISKKALVELMERENCILSHYERFELNLLRFIIRYSIGFFEGVIGFMFRFLFGEKIWEDVRFKRKSLYTGLSMFVFMRVK